MGYWAWGTQSRYKVGPDYTPSWFSYTHAQILVKCHFIYVLNLVKIIGRISDSLDDLYDPFSRHGFSSRTQLRLLSVLFFRDWGSKAFWWGKLGRRDTICWLIKELSMVQGTLNIFLGIKFFSISWMFNFVKPHKILAHFIYHRKMSSEWAEILQRFTKS